MEEMDNVFVFKDLYFNYGDKIILDSIDYYEDDKEE